GHVHRCRSGGSGERSRAEGQGARASRRAAGRHVEPGLRSWFRVPCGEGPASVPDAGPSCAPARLRAGPHRRHERPAGGRILLRPHSAGPPEPVLTWGGAFRWGWGGAWGVVPIAKWGWGVSGGVSAWGAGTRRRSATAECLSGGGEEFSLRHGGHHEEGYEP